MTTIDVDFDVFKALTLLRRTEEMTYSDVVRELLSESGCDQPKLIEPPKEKLGWTTKGVLFPEGTEFRAEHKGKQYDGIVSGGALVVRGQAYYSPSAAASSITNTSLNGWAFWECKFPGDHGWRPLRSLEYRTRS